MKQYNEARHRPIHLKLVRSLDGPLDGLLDGLLDGQLCQSVRRQTRTGRQEQSAQATSAAQKTRPVRRESRLSPKQILTVINNK